MLASACYEVTMSTRHDSSARGDVRDEYSARASSWSFRSADTNRHVDLDISRRAVAPKLAETIGTSHVVVADVSSRSRKHNGLPEMIQRDSLRCSDIKILGRFPGRKGHVVHVMARLGGLLAVSRKVLPAARCQRARFTRHPRGEYDFPWMCSNGLQREKVGVKV